MAQYEIVRIGSSYSRKKQLNFILQIFIMDKK